MTQPEPKQEQNYFLSDVEDAVNEAEIALTGLKEAEDPLAVLEELRAAMLALSQRAGEVGFAAIAKAAGKMAEYIDKADCLGNGGGGIRALHLYADTLRDLAEDYASHSALRVDDLLDQLPHAESPAKADIGIFPKPEAEITILLALPDRTSQNFFARELINSGLHVIKAGKAGDALREAALRQPDMAIIAAMLDDITGVELALALRAIPRTQKVKLALLTSFGQGHKELEGLPADIPVIRKTSFADDVADALVKLKVIYC